MTGPFDFLHIKGRTAGSSNELSFDVLDAARHDLDEKRKANRQSRPSATPSFSSGSYAGIAGTSTLSAVPEVERRKRARRARVIRVRALIIIAVVALVTAGGFAVNGFYQEKVDFTGRFGSLISQFVEIDRSLVEIDALMADSLNSVERGERDRAIGGFPELETRLEAVVADARRLQGDAASSSDSTALSEIENAARARENMLTTAADAFKLSEIANRQIAEATEAWNLVLAGDALAREGTALANTAATEEATVQAREKTVEAIEKMRSARSQLAVIEQGIAGLDFSAEIAYIDKRLESLDAAVQTSDALLAGDRAGAISANNAYNEADSEAVELAVSLPSSVSDLVKETYAGEVAAKEQAYNAARAAAAAADSALRAYQS